MIKVSVVGAKGRMGSHVVDAVDSAADTELALALDAGDDLTAITPENTDVVVEFTVPSVSLGNVLALVKQGVDVVVGTTGWTEEKLDQVRAALAAAPREGQSVFIAPNFAISAVLAEQIGLGLLGESGLDGACAQGAQSLGVSQGDVPSVAARILFDSHDDRDATAVGVLTTHDVARALRGDHEDRVVLGRLDVAVVDVEAMSEGDGGARLDVRFDIVGPDGALVLIGSQNHDDVGLGGGFRNGLDFQTLLLGVLDRLGGRAQADDDVDAGIAQVQRMGVALGTVTDDGNLLAFEDREIAVVLIPNLCSHCTWHSFCVVG